MNFKENQKKIVLDFEDYINIYSHYIHSLINTNKSDTTKYSEQLGFS